MYFTYASADTQATAGLSSPHKFPFRYSWYKHTDPDLYTFQRGKE